MGEAGGGGGLTGIGEFQVAGLLSLYASDFLSAKSAVKSSPKSAACSPWREIRGDKGHGGIADCARESVSRLRQSDGEPGDLPDFFGPIFNPVNLSAVSPSLGGPVHPVGFPGFLSATGRTRCGELF